MASPAAAARPLQPGPAAIKYRDSRQLDKARAGLILRFMKPVRMDDANSNDETSGGTQTLVRPRPKVQTPFKYKVILLNDDFTPMDFVTHILQKFFRKKMEEATQIMLQVHHQGAGVAGVYSYEIAETKAFQVNEYSKAKKHPLKCVIERA